MFKRNLYQKLIKEIYSDFYLIVTGARQVGKTTLLKQVFDFLKENNHLVFFLNLENPDYLKLLNEHPRNIFRIYNLPKNKKNVMNLLKILATQTASLLNINNLAKTLRLSHTAIENYLFTLKKAFIIYNISPFAKNVRNEIKKMPKAYYTDLGLRNALVKDFRPFDLKQDKGMIYENFIFRQFADRLNIDDIKFWRTQPGNEIDFIIQDRFAYKVKYNIDTLEGCVSDIT